MDFSLQKKIVLVGIVGCALFLFVFRDVGTAPPDETTGASAVPEAQPEAGTDPVAPGAIGDPGNDSAPRAPAAHADEATTAEPGRPGATDGLPRHDAANDDDAAPEGDVRTIWTPDKDGIRGSIGDSMQDLTECYAAWLRLHPDLAGKVTVSFAIETADGDDPDAPTAEDGTALAEVVDVDIVSDLEHTLMEGCVGNVFDELWFSPPGGGRMDVTYPLVFSPEE